jgi:hypothetical protein
MPETLIFDEYLYDLDAVNTAAEAYGHLADLKIAREDEVITVTMDNIPEEHADVLADSFCNHVLHETIVRVRSEAGEGVL